MIDWLASPWSLATIALLPLCLGDHDRFKTWAALLACSASAWMVTASTGATPFFIYILIDGAAMWLIARHPATEWQKLVGTCFLPMLFAHFGVLFSGRTTGGQDYLAINFAAGWLQFVILATWGMHDNGVAIGRAYRRWIDPMDDRSLAGEKR